MLLLKSVAWTVVSCLMNSLVLLDQTLSMCLSLLLLKCKAIFIIDTLGDIHSAKKEMSIALTELVNLSSFNNQCREENTAV